MAKKRPPYCHAWTPTPTGDGGRFYCIQPEGHAGQHVSPTSNADAVRHDLEWVIYGTSEGQELNDLRSQLARAKALIEVERKSREDYSRLLDDLAVALDASNFQEAVALAKKYTHRMVKAEAALRNRGKR